MHEHSVMPALAADAHVAAALSGSHYCSKFWFDTVLNRLVMLVITIRTCANGMGHGQ